MRPKALAVSEWGFACTIGVPAVAGHDDLGLDGDGAQVGNAHLLGHGSAAVGAEDPDQLAALRTGEAAHVLHHAEHGEVDLPAEDDAAAHVLHGHLLRRGDHDGAVRLLDELRPRPAARRPVPGGESTTR